MKHRAAPHGPDRPPVGWSVQLFLEGAGSAPYAGIITGYTTPATSSQRTRAICFGLPRNGGEGFTCWGLTHGHSIPLDTQWWEYIPGMEYKPDATTA